MSKDIANQLYLAYLGRPSDVGWRKSTGDLLNGAQPSVALQNAFYSAAVLDGVYSLNDSNATLVNKIFLNIFGFSASSFEQQQWGDLITKGFMTAQTAAWTIFSSYLGATNVPDLYKLPTQSKLIALDAYTTELGNNSAANVAVSQVGGAASVAARAFLSGVTSQATAASAINTIAATITDVSGLGTGQTYTLTTSPDTLVGTAGADTFNASLVYTGGAGAVDATSTLSVTDSINGGAGADTLNVIISGGTAAANFPAALFSSVETLNVRNVSGQENTIDASLITGVTAIVSDRSTAKVIVTNLADTASIGVKGDGTVANGATDFGYKTATAAITINVSGGVTAGNITGNATGVTDAATAATINSTAGANTVGTVDLLTGASTLTSLTINASSNLKGQIAAQTEGDFAASSTLTLKGVAATVELTGALANAIKTIDASGLTAGGIKATVGTGAETITGGAGVDTVVLNTGVKSANFGAGNDVVTTAAVNTTTAGTVIGGDGTDTLVVAAATDVDSSAKRSVYTGFETLQNDTTGGLAADGYAGVTAVITNKAGGGFTGLSATQASAVTNKIAQTAVTYSLTTATGTTDVLGVTLKSDTAATAADLAGSTITGFETLNVTVSSGGKTATGTKTAIGFTAAADLTALTVSGEFSATVTTTNTAKAVAITSSQTGTAVLDVTGNLIKGSVVTTTANVDAITTTGLVAGGAGDYVTYNAGAGDDAISTTGAAVNNTSGGNASLKIDGGAGTDTLTFTETGLSLADANFQYLTGIEKISNTTAGAVSVTTGGFFDNNFKGTGATFTLGETTGGAARTLDASSFTGKVTVTLSNNGAANVSTVKTGGGDDSVTLTQSATVNTTTHVVETGAGADTITAQNALVKITAGTGADTINITDGTNNADVLVINAGDSTVTGRDKVTGFQAVVTTGDQLDLAGTFAALATTAGTNGTDSGTIKSHATAAGGVVTFDTADTFAAAKTINEANLADALGYLTTNVTTAGTTAMFLYDSNSDGTNDATIVYQAGGGGTVVELVGLTTATSGLAAAAAATTIVIV